MKLELELDDVLLRAATEGARIALAERTEPMVWLTTADAAAHMGLSEQALRALRKRAAVPSHTSPQGHVRYLRAELDDYLRGQIAA